VNLSGKFLGLTQHALSLPEHPVETRKHHLALIRSEGAIRISGRLRERLGELVQDHDRLGQKLTDQLGPTATHTAGDIAQAGSCLPVEDEGRADVDVGVHNANRTTPFITPARQERTPPRFTLPD
jgi:hypothetical protein